MAHSQFNSASYPNQRPIARRSSFGSSGPSFGSSSGLGPSVARSAFVGLALQRPPSATGSSWSRAPSPARLGPTRASSPSPIYSQRPSRTQAGLRPMSPPPSYRPPSALSRPLSPAGAKPTRPASTIATPSRSRSLRSSNNFGSTLTHQHVLEVHGDSFAGVFSLLPSVKMSKYKGGTARGLANSSSSTGYGALLLSRVERSRPKHVLLQFGSVDLHVGYTWQLKARQAQALGPEPWIKQAISSYTNFILEQLMPRMSPGSVVYVSGVQLPVVEDRFLDLATQKYCEKEGCGPLGPLPPASVRTHPHDIATRRAMVRAYNHLLHTFCSRFPDRIVFIDINAGISDSSGRVRREMVDPCDPTNIHLIWETTLPHWIQALPPLRQANIRLDQAQLQSNLAGFHAEKHERMNRHSFTRSLIGAGSHPAWQGTAPNTAVVGGGWR